MSAGGRVPWWASAQQRCWLDRTGGMAVNPIRVAADGHDLESGADNSVCMATRGADQHRNWRGSWGLRVVIHQLPVACYPLEQISRASVSTSREFLGNKMLECCFWDDQPLWSRSRSARLIRISAGEAGPALVPLSRSTSKPRSAISTHTGLIRHIREADLLPRPSCWKTNGGFPPFDCYLRNMAAFTVV
jgi:hypothetical protein